jgi:hypothetical protein
MEFVRLLFALAAQEGWRVHHMDVKSVFLNGDLKEEVYVHQPPGFAIPGKEGKVLPVDVIGTEDVSTPAQGPLWLVIGTEDVECQVGLHAQGDGLRAKPARGGHLPAGNGGNALLMGVYVDDLVITGTKDAEVVAFKEEMKATLHMSDLGPLSYLGIEVHQGDFGIMLRQTAYTKRVVKLAGITDCNPALTPMEERLKLSRDNTMEEVDAT